MLQLKRIKRIKLKKSNKLFQHYIDHSEEYSFEINNKLISIKNELEKL